MLYMYFYYKNIFCSKLSDNASRQNLPEPGTSILSPLAIWSIMITIF